MFGIFKKKDKEHRLFPVIKGKAVSMKDVPDPTFANELLGKGIAYLPDSNEIVAPCDGRVEMIFDTLHAISIVTDYGAEILIHIGLETVKLKGQYFKARVKAGDRVNQGDILITADFDKIKDAGYQIITPIVICNVDEFDKIEIKKIGQNVDVLDEVILIKEK